MITRRLLCVAVLLAIPGAGSADDVPVVAPPKSWDHFVILPWQFKTDVSRDKALYESVNLQGFHIDRMSGSLQAFARETSWPYYVDHAAGKGYLHLGAAGDAIQRKSSIVARPNSLADPRTMDAMKKLLRANIESAKGSSVVGYSFDDEISTGSFCSPIETDGSAASVSEYRKFLEQQYSTIGKLNAEYATSFRTFEEISPQSYEAFRPQLAPNSIGKLNLSPWCDWRSFMDTQMAGALGELTRYANSLDPLTPAGFVGAQSPSAYGGYDYRKLAGAVQWMEAYDIGGSNEILRSFWGQKRPHVQTYFSSKNPRQDSWFLWYYLCHGNRGVIGWPDGWFSNGKVADYIQASALTFKEVQGPVSRKIINGEFVHDPIAIYYSHPSIQVGWAMDASTHRGTWPNRSSSMDNSIGTSNLTRVAWLKTLEDLGLQATFLHQDHLLDGALLKGGYKVLLLNRVLCLSDAEASAIRSFAAKGGAVIADTLCGVFDEHGKAREIGVLDDLFGVKHDLAKGILGGNTLTEVDGERGGNLSDKTWAVQGASTAWDLPVFERGLSVGRTAKAEHEADSSVALVRQGKNVYLNLSPLGYLLKRPKNEGRTWTAGVASLLKELGVTPRVSISERGQPAAQMEILTWRNPDRMTLCILKNLDRKASIDGFGSAEGALGDGKIRLKLSFAHPVKDLKNERTGKTLGDGLEFEDEWTPWEANVYTYAP
ncbi:MAG TPA: alpha-amylase family protein [Planctomycetota bacterium]|nr:alpha-amylase family protein [Planctomycetota bacterium]